jgi:hypothetical protein
MMKADDPFGGRSEEEAEVPTGKQPSNGMSTPQRVEADLLELLPDEKEWERERKNQRWHKFKTP